MKRLITCLLVLCMLFSLVGCGGGNTAGSETDTPDTEQNTPDPQPDSSTDIPGTSFTELTTEELAQWTKYFNSLEHNGLLRFSYAGLNEDPDILTPNLHWLFYDIGEHESTFTDEENALLEAAGLWLELDSFRLSREFIKNYLFENFNIAAETADALLETAQLGVYLEEYDAWYISHGDTAYSNYSIEEGWVYENGTVCLRYFNDFLAIVQENGDMDFVDTTMLVTLIPREDGTYYIASHEIDSGVWEK